jgi:DNA polymerase III subunit delta'
LSLAPLPGSRKIAIVDDADTMNEASANSFLKTLEEPPARAVLFLIASNLDALLPTIRSRCQLVRFAPLAVEDVRALLLEEGLVHSDDEAEFASGLSEGSLFTAQQLLEPELRNLRTLIYQQLARPNLSGLGLSKQLIDGLTKISSDTPEQRRNAQWVIRFTVDFLRTCLRSLNFPATPADSRPETATFVSQIRQRPNPQELLGTLIERTIDASSHIDHNVPVALAVDALYDDLAHHLRLPSVTR